jgi:aerobic carbon-monoxide dehydrogenase medium subunit
MIPAPFAYDRASNLDEALALLHDGGAETKVIAGGQSLLPLMKLRLARPERVLDIGRLDELRGVREGPSGGLWIGALTTWAELLADERVLRYGALADVLPRIADVQVRNRGTIGGSLVHADPASDIAAPALALSVELLARSVRGERTLGIEAFFLGPFVTALEPDEILTEIRLPGAAGRVGSAYQAIEQPASGYALAGVAAVVGRREGLESGGGHWDLCRVAVTGVGDGPYRASEVEDAVLAGATFDEAARLVTRGQHVGSDIHADAEYRAAVAALMTRRALEAASARF